MTEEAYWPKVPPGKKLDEHEREGLSNGLRRLFSEASLRRKRTEGEIIDLYSIIASLLRFGGMPVESSDELFAKDSDVYNVRLIFDPGVGTMLIHVVEGTLNYEKDELIQGILQTQEIMQWQGAFLGIDCLRYNELNESKASDELKEFMNEYPIGVILADPYFLVIAFNWNQLMFIEMPLVIAGPELLGSMFST